MNDRFENAGIIDVQFIHNGSRKHMLARTLFIEFETLIHNKLRPLRQAIAVSGGSVKITVLETMNVKVDFLNIPPELERKVRTVLQNV